MLMANTFTLNGGEGNEVKSKIPFFYSTPSSPLLPESHSPAEPMLNSFFPSFQIFPCTFQPLLILLCPYLPTVGLQTQALSAFHFLCQESSFCLRMARTFRVLLLSAQNCHLLCDLLCKQGSMVTTVLYPTLHAHSALRTMYSTEKVLDKFWMDTWVST